MTIVYLVPSSGGAFYCGNCLRDSSFLKTIKNTGQDLLVVPMYLPLMNGNSKTINQSPVFFGAVSLYLKNSYKWMRKMPKWIENLLNSDFLLNYAAKKAGSTRATGLEDMTISMLKGEHGNQVTELNELVNWLKEHVKPDVIHISNALLLGMAPKIKKELNATLICSLQDEDEWIDEMELPIQQIIWNLVRYNSEFIDGFISVSEYYAQYFVSKITIPENKIHVIYNGIEITKKEETSLKPRVIGFMSKMCESFGLDILIDAFILLKKKPEFTDVKLKITGGYTSDNKPFIRAQQNKIKSHNLNEVVEFIEDFSDENRHLFLQSLTIYSVPSRRKEAFGMHVLEALGAGVPVVLPNHGAYTELVTLSQAGLVFEPNRVEDLLEKLEKILSDDALLLSMQKNCFTFVNEHFHHEKQAYKTIEMYEKVISRK